MALGKTLEDFANQFNSLYNITLDMSGWDKATLQVTSPMGGALAIQASNNANGNDLTDGDASLAINFSSVQVKNLQTGSSVNYIYGAGLYEYDVNARFLRVQGQPAAAGTSVYNLIIFNSKIS